jgi:hypothetical protein
MSPDAVSWTPVEALIMRTSISLPLAVLFALATGSFADAATKQCRDAKGKFIKCEAAAAPTKCRDMKTKKFAKCGLPGTEAVP